MRKRPKILVVLLAGAIGGMCWPHPVAAQTPASPRISYVEEMVTAYRPVQSRVIVPVVVGRQTRWEERIQTTYVPELRRQYRPVVETSLRELPPLKLAERPRVAASSPRSIRPYDALPLVAIEQAPAARTASAPATTLVPREFKPAR